MRVLLLSAYDADSHRYWRQGLEANLPDYQWTCLSLPPRYFNWRVRGNSMSWAFSEREALSQPYDLVVATSMVDLSALRGFVPSLAATPCLVYFHENQFAYPASERQHPGIEPQMVNLYSALCADRIAFNSHYNRRSFLEGVAALLARLPDHVPEGIVAQLEKRSEVLPVPLFAEAIKPTPTPTPTPTSAIALSSGVQGVWSHEVPLAHRPLRILWAARWEYDKGPKQLLAILRELDARNVDYELCLLGQSFRNSPPEFTQIEKEFRHRLVQFGYAQSRVEYLQWLKAADVVLSTAIHEFQGLAILEAIAAGCIPVLPDRLAYPELVDQGHLFQSRPESVAEEADSAVGLLSAFALNPNPTATADPFKWQALETPWRALLENSAGRA